MCHAHSVAELRLNCTRSSAVRFLLPNTIAERAEWHLSASSGAPTTNELDYAELLADSLINCNSII